MSELAKLEQVFDQLSEMYHAVKHDAMELERDNRILSDQLADARRWAAVWKRTAKAYRDASALALYIAHKRKERNEHGNNNIGY